MLHIFAQLVTGPHASISHFEIHTQRSPHGFVRHQGLITRDEYDALCAADALDRQHAYEDRWGTA